MSDEQQLDDLPEKILHAKIPVEYMQQFGEFFGAVLPLLPHLGVSITHEPGEIFAEIVVDYTMAAAAAENPEDYAVAVEYLAALSFTQKKPDGGA